MNNKIRILINCEVYEELEEIIGLLEGEGERASLYILAPKSIIKAAENKSLKCFKQPSLKFWRLGEKVLVTIHFFIIASLLRPKLLFTGFSMLRHRLYSLIYRARHVSYFRSLLFTLESKGLSNRLYQMMPAPWTFKRVFQPHLASLILTTSLKNQEMLVTQGGIDRERIILTPPPWLKDKVNTHSTPKIKRTFIITQAFSSHGLFKEHEHQLMFLKKLNHKLNNSDHSLYLRVHPRDTYRYDLDPDLQDLLISDGSPDEFMRNLTSRDLIISPLSTLGFELLYLNHKVKFFLQDGTENLYSSWLKSIDAELHFEDGVKWIFIKENVFFNGASVNITKLLYENDKQSS